MKSATTLLLTLLLLAPSASAADWLQNGYDAAHTNDSPDAGPATDDVAWRVHLGGSASTFTPIVIVGGNAYVRTSSLGIFGLDQTAIYRVNLSTAKLDLLVDLHDRKSDGPSLASDGHLLFATLNGGIAAYPLAGGNPVWTQPWPVTPSNHGGSMCGWVSVHEGTVYVGCVLFVPTATPLTGAGTVTFCAAYRATDGELKWVWSRDSNGAAPLAQLPSLPEPSTGAQAVRAFPTSVTVLGQTVLFATLDITSTAATFMSSASYFALAENDGHLLWSKNNTPSSGTQVFSYPGGTPTAAYLSLDLQRSANPTDLASILVSVNPTTGADVWSEPLGAQDARAFIDSNGFAIDGDALFTASAQTAYRFNTTNHIGGWRTTLDPSIQENFVSANLVLANGTVYAQTQNLTGNGSGSAVYAFRASDGRLSWTRELPATRTGWGGWPSSVVAVGDGLLLIGDVDGNLTAIGHTAASLQPRSAVSDTSPDPGRAVTVDLSATAAGVAGPATEFRAVWGDGTASPWQSSPVLAHTYARAGDYRARLIARNDANQTASTFVTFTVGAPKPVPLNAAQRALAPENQNFTFFAIGAFFTIVGALIGAIRLRRRRRILTRELRALEAVYAKTRDRPAECDIALGERKAHARGLLVDGKLDESQYQVLERRIEELSRTLRLGELDRRFEFLPMGMVNTLREMLKDGAISVWEHRHFVEALDRDELLTFEQKAKVRALIDRWFERDSGASSP